MANVIEGAVMRELVATPKARRPPPTACRAVQYRLPDDEGGEAWQAAVVTRAAREGALDPYLVALEVFGVVESSAKRRIFATEGTEVGDWRWPPTA